MKVFMVIEGGKRNPPPILGQPHYLNCIAGFFSRSVHILCCTDLYAWYEGYVASKVLVVSSRSDWCHNNYVNAHASDATIIIISRSIRKHT